MTNAERTARNMIKGLTMMNLLAQWELTETSSDVNIAMVRGWLMDELEARNPEAFDAWLEDENPEATPRTYFAA